MHITFWCVDAQVCPRLHHQTVYPSLHEQYLKVRGPLFHRFHVCKHGLTLRPSFDVASYVNILLTPVYMNSISKYVALSIMSFMHVYMV